MTAGALGRWIEDTKGSLVRYPTTRIPVYARYRISDDYMAFHPRIQYLPHRFFKQDRIECLNIR